MTREAFIAADVKCRCGAAARRFVPGVKLTHQGINGKARLFTQYPVISNRLPFGLEVKGVDIKHHGPLQKCVIESRDHERRVYDRIDAKRGD